MFKNWRYDRKVKEIYIQVMFSGQGEADCDNRLLLLSMS